MQAENGKKRRRGKRERRIEQERGEKKERERERKNESKGARVFNGDDLSVMNLLRNIRSVLK